MVMFYWIFTLLHNIWNKEKFNNFAESLEKFKLPYIADLLLLSSLLLLLLLTSCSPWHAYVSVCGVGKTEKL